jgi:fimbrial chaperone protein
MSRRHFSRAAGCLVLFMALEGAGHAGSFEVNPVRANLSAGQRVAALTVRNSGRQPAIIQLQAMDWTQEENQDRLTPTSGILATPPLFTLAPGASQIVRVGMRKPPDGNVEAAYRLLLQEVPPPPEPGFKGLRVALKISIPVFVAPAAPAHASVVWHAERAGNGKLLLSVSNEGQAHTHLTGLTLRSSPAGERMPLGDGNAYVLPHASHAWQVETATGSVGTMQVDGRDDSGPVHADVVVHAR